MRPSAGMQRGGGASLPYGGPTVETDALIGVNGIRCLERCQNQHSANKVFTHTQFHMEQRGATRTILLWQETNWEGRKCHLALSL